ncbi:ComF family protein [Deefgea piscis]|uniref:ComF family protein n=1 Tax=Deefgea piscis TaxID=2739061 RepID=UPI001C7E7E82|nr:ComF family protein [Deefgea piscis]QZA79898.1 ComF family protein [Deefgea piscis]
MSNLFDRILNYISPQQCLLCAASSKNSLCEPCLTTLDRPCVAQSCPCCARPSTQGLICGACSKNPPAFDATIAAFLYADPIACLIQAAKFAGRWSLLPPLGELLAERLSSAARPDLIIPLPLHPARLKERGFNQALEIAQPISKRLQLPLDLSNLSRHKNTEHQARLSANARWHNMRNAFVCCASVNGLRIALVDDVMTSGASMNAAAKALKSAGAIEVFAWVVARTP